MLDSLSRRPLLKKEHMNGFKVPLHILHLLFYPFNAIMLTDFFGHWCGVSSFLNPSLRIKFLSLVKKRLVSHKNFKRLLVTVLQWPRGSRRQLYLRKYSEQVSFSDINYIRQQNFTYLIIFKPLSAWIPRILHLFIKPLCLVLTSVFSSSTPPLCI